MYGYDDMIELYDMSPSATEVSTMSTISIMVPTIISLIFGIITIKQKNSDENILSKNNSIMKKNISYILFIAFSIAIGELGDKTFLASIGLGIQYPCFKIMLICGAIFGMIVSDSIAIIFGKFLSKKVPDNIINLCSGLLFLIFGFIGFINFIL